MQQNLFDSSINDLDKILDGEIGEWQKQYPPEGKWRAGEMGAELGRSIQIFQNFRNAYLEFFQSNVAELDAGKVDWYVNRMYSILFSHWEPFQRSAEQYSIPQYKALLDKGYARILEFRDSGFISAKVPTILYFEKVGKAIRFPFAPTYVIGIPMFDAYRNDWSAIPHELGHHIYWNSKFLINGKEKIPLFGDHNIFADMIAHVDDGLDLPLSKSVLLRSKFSAWEEEIFAEVVGTRIGRVDAQGTSATQTAFYTEQKDFATQAVWDKLKKQIRNGSDLLVDDGSHPLPLLLPYIRAYARAALPDSSPSLVSAQDWTNFLSVKLEELLPKNSNNRFRGAVNFPKAMAALEVFVKGISDPALITGNLTVSGFQEILSFGLENPTPTDLIERALDVNFSFLERNEFTCMYCGTINKGSAGSSPCTKCGMSGSYWTAGIRFFLGG